MKYIRSLYHFNDLLLLKEKQWTLIYDIIQHKNTLTVDMPILTCIFFTFNWLTLTSEMHFVKFHPGVASCLLSRGKRKYAPLGMRLLWKYIRNSFLVYHTFCYISKATKNLKLKLLICNHKNTGFHLISKNILLSVEPWRMRMWSA